ncbi:glycosidase family 31 [Holotrichia oblita]|uniref:Glycosidase family 31 n=1 Tax=Holotrichia oblita TaxID=644536 RepID=A0ACB9TAI7_HOLOL|nr:glycosidase family 31 [Holotrichia oblita]
MLSTLLVFAGLLLCIQAQSISMQKDEVSISVEYADNSLNLVFSHNEEQKLQAQIGLEANLENILECNGVDNCLQFDDIRLHITSNIENGFTILWTTTNTTHTFRDCFSLDSDNTNWFGGPERYDQYWPIEKLTLTNFPNVPHEDQWGAIVEPYWLNSKGAYIFVDERVPLFIDQNTNDTDDSVCFVAKIETPYPSSRTRILLNYTISAGANAREGHLHAVQHFLGKPSGHPANALIENPIWSTWARLQNLRNNHGFDTYKFDAGETSWAPQTPNLYGDVEKLPSSMTAEYVRACAIFGDYIEVRAGWGTQDLPVFVRMIDKDSRWGLNNGLRSLVTTLLQMNMNGYTMVLPDMVGGNGYEDERPSAEMFIRWLQANTFMPNIQFSYVPWDFDDDTVIELSRKFVELHAQYADEIIKAMEKSISDGYPVNPPVWWVDPTNSEALIQDTEYMLGEDILVAPVLEEGAVTRDIYLPSGTWEDGNTGEIYEGGQTLTDYEAPLEVLPYFIRYNSAVFAGLLLCIQAQSISMQKDEVSISVEYADNSLNLVFSHNEEQKLQAQIGLEANLENILECNGVDNCLQFDDIRLHITSNIENGFTILWTTTNTTHTFRDCFSLDSDNTNWFGGPERYDQYWPIEKLTLTNFPNVPHEDQWGAIVEPYWLNSKGAYIFVDERVPLFIDQNTNDTDDSVCFVAKIETPYPSSRTRILLNYTISAGANAREGHLHAVQHFLGKPSGHPANALIENPIWSTWARYKKEIDDALLIQFANEIIENGFSGQFEIDDYWETCYGSLTFRSPEFDDIDNTVQTIKNMGFTVALWTHPFVNIDCNYTQIGIDNGKFK